MPWEIVGILMSICLAVYLFGHAYWVDTRMVYISKEFERVKEVERELRAEITENRKHIRTLLEMQEDTNDSLKLLLQSKEG